MKALLSTFPGGTETLEVGHLPVPEPGPGEARVRVKACGVNFFDALIIEDMYQYKPQRPFAPGSEIAGVIEALGEGVDGLAVGDRVLGNIYWGGMAQARVAKAVELVRIPDSMPFEVAAGFPVTYGTSYHALRDRAALKPGQTLLVLGAAGGVGLAAVELGKAMGARVIAAASSQEKVDLCRAYGADASLVYPRGPFDRDGQKELARLFKDAAGPDGADVILDVVGDDYAEPALRAIAWGGKYLVVGFAAGAIPRIPLNLPLLKGCDIAGVFWGDWVTRNPEGNQQATAELLELYASGRIRPFVSEQFPLARGGEAIQRLADRKALGKVVVTIE